MTTEHTIILEEIGGANVISCPALGFRHIEHSGKITDAEIKTTILHYLYLTPDDSASQFVFHVEDNRPEPENFNEKRAREAKEYKPKRRF